MTIFGIDKYLYVVQYSTNDILEATFVLKRLQGNGFWGATRVAHLCSQAFTTMRPLQAATIQGAANPHVRGLAVIR